MNTPRRGNASGRCKSIGTVSQHVKLFSVCPGAPIVRSAPAKPTLGIWPVGPKQSEGDTAAPARSVGGGERESAGRETLPSPSCYGRQASLRGSATRYSVQMRPVRRVELVPRGTPSEATPFRRRPHLGGCRVFVEYSHAGTEPRTHPRFRQEQIEGSAPPRSPPPTLPSPTQENTAQPAPLEQSSCRTRRSDRHQGPARPRAPRRRHGTPCPPIHLASAE